MKTIGGYYQIGKKIGNGSFGEIYEGINLISIYRI
jgi:serine/threonine protein kinase